MHGALTGLLAGLASLVLAASGEKPRRLSVGATVREKLGPGAALEYEIVGEKTGSVSVELSSLDFDAALEAWSAQGPIAIAGNRGVETDEIATLELSANRVLRLRVHAADRGSGEFVLSALERATSLDERWTARKNGFEERARKALGRDDPRSAAAFFERAGQLCRRYGVPREARAHFEHQLEAEEKSGDRLSIAEARVQLGSVENLLGDSRGALDTLVKAETEESRLDDRHRLVLLQSLGVARFDIGEREAGLKLLTRAIELARKVGDKEPLALALAAQAARLTEARRLDQAEGLLTEAEHLATAVQDSAVRIEVLNVKARWLYECARWRDALRTCREALELEPRPTTRFLILGTMAAAHEKLNELSDANRFGLDSQNLCDSLGVQGFEDEYLILFGNILLKSNDPDRAREKLEEALGILVERNEPEKQIEALVSIAMADYALGDLDGQRSACERILEISTRLKDRRGECQGGYLLGRALQISAPKDSEKYLLHSIELSHTLGDIDIEADALGMLAWGQHVWGKEREAMEGARTAGHLYDSLDKRLQSLEVLDTQVVAALGCGDLAAAIDGIDDASARFERAAVEAPDDPAFSTFDQIVSGFAKHAQDWVAKSIARSGASAPKDEMERSALDQDRREVLERGLRLAGMFKSRELLRVMVSNRGGDLGASERSIRSELQQSQVEWEARLAARTERLRRDTAPSEMASLIQDVESARKRCEALRGDLARIVGESLQQSVPPRAVLQEVRQALPADSLLIEYVFGNDRLYAYSVSTEDARFVELGPSRDWEQAVREFVTGLCGEAVPIARQTPAEPRGLLALNEIRARGERLYSGLVAPLLGTSTATPHELVIVPSGYLCTLPFEALTAPADAKAAKADPTSQPHYLIEKLAIAYAPSTPVLVELAKLAERRRKVWPPTALLLADPSYAEEKAEQVPMPARDGGDDAKRSRGNLPALRRLDSSRDEVCSIAGHLRTVRGDADPRNAEAILRIQQGKESASSDSLIFPGVELHVGANATRARFLERSSDFSLLHVAAHGFADVQDPDEGCFVLSWDAADEGKVTARDVLARGLAADLTVLAACQTAVGTDAPHEGVLSLSRAFLHAGSSSVIASLWSADDLRSSELMEHFYAQYLDHEMSASAALREAKLHLLRKPTTRSPGVQPPGGRVAGEARKVTSADPYYWAPYVYFGLPQ